MGYSVDPARGKLWTTCMHVRCNLSTALKLTINVPVVFVARYVMVLRGATSLRGTLEGVGPSNDVAPLKTIKYKGHKNNWYIGSFMYSSAVVVCCCVLLCVRGVGRSPCSCVVWGGIQGVGAGWQGSPSHYSVSIHGCMLVGGGGGGAIVT